MDGTHWPSEICRAIPRDSSVGWCCETIVGRVRHGRGLARRLRGASPMPAIARTRTVWSTFATTILIAAFTGCGSSGGTVTDTDGASGGGDDAGGRADWAAGDAPAQGQCANDEIFCRACNGGAYCAHVCPNLFTCPVLADGGDSDAAGADSGACAAGQVPCLDCSGGLFCVVGSCPLASCPVRDAGIDAPALVDGSGDVRSDSNPIAPDGGAGAPCRNRSDCQQLYSCAGPVPFSCTCPSGSCMADTDCARDGGTFICESFCGGACTKQCVVGCTDATCPEGTHCGTSHRCESKPCTSAADCPAQFDCISGVAGSVCLRRACQIDSDCATGGYCVDRSCSTQLGMCLAQSG
jgi:hypothetical protein